jgi:hypothetical protein
VHRHFPDISISLMPKELQVLLDPGAQDAIMENNFGYLNTTVDRVLKGETNITLHWRI